MSVLLVLPVVCFAQTPAPIGIVRGDLLEWKGDKDKNDGTLRVRSLHDGQNYDCQVDRFTYLERENERIVPSALRVGETIEIIADQKPGGKCYARTVRVTTQTGPAKPGQRPAIRVSRSPLLDAVYPRGNVTYAGVVVRMAPGVLVLRTRNDGEQQLLLRGDTRYLEGGSPSAIEALGVNTRVFVRCGRNLENDLEVYQVIWGEISGPKRPQQP
ncbi:MAG TPA: hypothetical protein VE621_08010 [Bryobacteraceae bacterium]|nr:hypothetical protein [Bryobacteraceae bacterium]